MDETGSPEGAPPPIRFGTDGWRAPLGAGPTFLQVGRIAAAVAAWLEEEGWRNRPVAVGYDTRLLAPVLAEEIARVLAAGGLEVLLTKGFVPTPCLSYLVTAETCAAGLMVTASHNPPEYVGVKVKASHGGSIDDEAARWIAARATEIGAGDLPPLTTTFDALRKQKRIKVVDPKGGYVDHMMRCLGPPPQRRCTYSLLASSMRGATQGVVVQAFHARGLNISEIENARDVTFGGRKPEPVAANLALERRLRRLWDRDVVFVADGDGDRLTLIDERDRVLTAHDLFLLLLQHLVEVRGQRGAVLHAVNLSRAIPAMARHYGLPERQLPVGFKHVARAMVAGDVLIGGEEAGGIGVQGYLKERDAIYLALLVAEAMWERRKLLGRMVDELREAFGAGPYERRDLTLTPEAMEAARARLAAEPPAEVAGIPVERVNRLDGVRLELADSAWCLARPSGTEPLLRLYAEAAPGGDPAPLLAALEAWLTGATGR
ncbi:MAG: phosphoglucomutase/phosphomannomutase family protein [Nitrospirae bacterium]|nr:MAG: phosphoglucomutase/phosphomannomutase family protein [Nitrospirota bacterium]